MTDAGGRLIAMFRRNFLRLASAARVGRFMPLAPRSAVAMQGGTMYGRIGR
jgi:hypothetical protein